MHRLWILAVLVCVVSMPAPADENAPLAVVRTATEQMLSQLDKQPELRRDAVRLSQVIELILLPHLDFEGLSRLTLGRHWKQASAQQRETFIREFRDLLVRSYSSALTAYTDQSVEFLSSSYSGESDRARVKTRIVSAGQPPVAIDYRLHRLQGHWKIYDVSIEGASLAVNYRNSFAEQIRTHGLDGLITQLMAQNAKGCVSNPTGGTAPVPC